MVGQKKNNYINNYFRRNKLTLAQSRVKFFTETHERFLEAIVVEIKRFLENWS